MSLPAFDSAGLLPRGDHAISLTELANSHLVRGGSDVDLWDAPWRRQLMENLAILVGHLREVGISEIYIDGSFVEAKPHPNDIDGYFHTTLESLISGELESRLQKLDAVWTWDPDRRYPLHAGAKSQLPMWHKFRVELFPHVGQGPGIVDAFGNELEFPAAFRLTGDFRPKGILKLTGDMP
jgi:hypothetical protein